MHVLAARIRRVDPSRGRAGVPQIDRAVELHPRVAARVRGFGDNPQQLARAQGVGDLAGLDEARVPSRIVLHRLHELVADAHRIVGVLEEDRAVGGTVERGIVARFDQRPRLALLFLLALDELDDIGMVRVEDHHLGRAAGLAARLDHAGRGVGRFHERERARGRATRGKLLAARAQRRKIYARARAAFEDHPLVAVPAEDRFHVVVDLQDKARGALRFGLDSDVEVDRAVERGLLTDQEIGQFGLEGVAIFDGAEVILLLAPSGDRLDHATDQLAHAVFAAGDGGLGLRTERPAEVLRDHYVGRGLRPRSRHFHVLLLKDHPPVFARDHGRAILPLDLAHRIDARAREVAPDRKPAAAARGLGELRLPVQTSGHHPTSLNFPHRPAYVVRPVRHSLACPGLLASPINRALRLRPCFVSTTTLCVKTDRQCVGLTAIVGLRLSRTTTIGGMPNLCTTPMVGC